MKTLPAIALVLLNPTLASGFARKALLAQHQAWHRTSVATSPMSPSCTNGKDRDLWSISTNDSMLDTLMIDSKLILPAAIMSTALPVEAAGVLPSALWAYGHYLSILAITGCLIAERILVKPDMSVEDEDTIVKIDVVYGVMAALLIISGFARAYKFGQGGDFYIHEPLFWLKMTFSGIWGGLSIFPSFTFYQRKGARKNDEIVPPLTSKLAARLHQVINAEITAILSIPFLATLMARGVWYWQDFPWQVGLVFSIVATGGSFYLYGKQAFNWTEDADEDEIPVVSEK